MCASKTVAGTVLPTTDAGSTATGSCAPGYQLNATAPTLSCDINGAWDASISDPCLRTPADCTHAQDNKAGLKLQHFVVPSFVPVLQRSTARTPLRTAARRGRRPRPAIRRRLSAAPATTATTSPTAPRTAAATSTATGRPSRTRASVRPLTQACARLRPGSANARCASRCEPL